MTGVQSTKDIQTRTFRAFQGLLLIPALVCAPLYLCGYSLTPQSAAVVKSIPVFCLAVFLIAGPRGRATPWIASGLLCSAAGDYMLNMDSMIVGMAAFFLAHVCYAIGFLSVFRGPALLAAVPYAAWGVVVFLTVKPNLHQLLVPLAVYIAMISVMMWRALAQTPRAFYGWLGLVGSLLFGLSDTLIAWNSWTNLGPYPGWLIMASYWIGQIFLAAWGRHAIVRER